MELNRLKVLLVERKKTGKWLAETLGKNEATVPVGVQTCLNLHLKHCLLLLKRWE